MVRKYGMPRAQDAQERRWSGSTGRSRTPCPPRHLYVHVCRMPRAQDVQERRWSGSTGRSRTPCPPRHLYVHVCRMQWHRRVCNAWSNCRGAAMVRSLSAPAFCDTSTTDLHGWRKCNRIVRNNPCHVCRMSRAGPLSGVHAIVAFVHLTSRDGGNGRVLPGAIPRRAHQMRTTIWMQEGEQLPRSGDGQVVPEERVINNLTGARQWNIYPD